MEIDFDEVLGYVSHYLKYPSVVWKDANLDKRLKLQWFQFPQGITFKNEDYGTAEIASVFKTKDAFSASLSFSVDIVSKSWNQIESYIFDTYRVLEQYQYA